MSDKIIDTNVVTVLGEVDSDLRFSHEMYGEGFYTLDIKVPRLSDHSDVLPVTVSERILVDLNLTLGTMVKVDGQLRSYNKYMDGSNKLVLTIFARDMTIYSGEEELKNPNQIFLNGYICKHPVYRTTPFGREITDMLVAVNRPYNKSDYIPCIAWGRNARFSEKLKVGDHIKIWGRVQSREYQKRLNEEELITKMAYEVSISKMEIVEEDNNREVN
ncbi:single-stranded DNA-binding protein [Geosporobacter ferrireducens]|uniref:Single-stranded DNA-binding protein n=1 Tax=Geosporobacter ferrireducens TaxID=1424294 RepID=A0A1D8GD64_9FIRM|nr:single-stranded DNA-binding protein [Geosporobacter ferrireducens]AOT68836.1 single-stranded DNA-binding protein [Geosporobacter ferrireducens]MTI56501.1 single-stranded DNA-binding protein [Geosporobacter ferrireducens]